MGQGYIKCFSTQLILVFELLVKLFHWLELLLGLGYKLFKNNDIQGVCVCVHTHILFNFPSILNVYFFSITPSWFFFAIYKFDFDNNRTEKEILEDPVEFLAYLQGLSLFSL